MIIKVLEIRDRMTCIPAIAIKMVPINEVQGKFLWRCGYPQEERFSIVLMRLDDQRASSDAYWWDDRTHQTAHLYIEAHFDDLKEGDVVDVSFILGEADKPAKAEIWQKVNYKE